MTIIVDDRKKERDLTFGDLAIGQWFLGEMGGLYRKSDGLAGISATDNIALEFNLLADAFPVEVCIHIIDPQNKNPVDDDDQQG